LWYGGQDTKNRIRAPSNFVAFVAIHVELASLRNGWNGAKSEHDGDDDEPLGYRINIFLARLCFRGIYFPMMGRLAWLKVVAQNRRTIFKLVKEAFFGRRTRPSPEMEDSYEDVAAPDVSGEVSA
jgi:hypothetical protein